MPGSEYIAEDEYADFGLPSTVTPQMVRAASALVDGHLGRPEGLVWLPDAGGNPAYMAAPSPRLTLRTVGSVAPGSSVAVTYTGASLDNNAVGEVVVLDSTSISKVEACIVTAVAPGSITLKTVQYAHLTNCAVEFGLTIMEERELPGDRSIARVARTPIMRLLSGVGRYGYGRRSDQITGNMQEFNLLAAVSSFGGPPLWIPWEVSNASVSNLTGEVWIPAGILLAYYTEVRIWYVAGFPEDAIPRDLKQATANIVELGKDKGLGPNIRSRNVRDGTVSSRWENNMIDHNTRQLLSQFLARRFV